MIKSKNVLRGLSLVFAVTFAFAVAQPVIASISADGSNLATSTYYDYKWWALWTARDKITTSYSSKSTTPGTKSTVLNAINNTSQIQSYGYSYTKELSGTVSLGASIPIKAIELEVGAEVSYKYSETVSANVSVPAHHTYIVYKSQDKKDTKYKNIVQNQLFYTDGTWKNNGSARTEYSTWTEKYPTITISK